VQTKGVLFLFFQQQFCNSVELISSEPVYFPHLLSKGGKNKRSSSGFSFYHPIVCLQRFFFALNGAPYCGKN